VLKAFKVLNMIKTTNMLKMLNATGPS